MIILMFKLFYAISFAFFVISQIIFMRYYEQTAPGIIPIGFSLICLFLGMFLDNHLAWRDRVIAFHLLVFSCVITVIILIIRGKAIKKELTFLKGDERKK